MAKAKRRTYNIRRIHLKQSYSVQEVAELFGLHKNSVLNWVKDGLRLNDDKKPYLVHGGVLSDYLKARQAKRKQLCKVDEFYCFKCRAPRRPWEGVVDIAIQNKTKLWLSGLCDHCNTMMYKASGLRRLPEYQKIFEVQTIQEEHIRECVAPIGNCDFRKDKINEQVQSKK